MKKLICLLLCLMMALPCAALAEDTLPEKFQKQLITGGNGLRGTVALTASGSADWVSYIQPFAGAALQLRAIGQAQGTHASIVTDDDNWQIKLYAKDDQSEMRGLTYLYGDPQAIYIKSDLLPGTLLTIPAESAHVLYSIAQGEMLDLFAAIDPLGLNEQAAGENLPAYSAIAKLLQVEEAEWAEAWQPVMDKYETDLDMWLAGYTSGPVVGGSTGAMTMCTTFTIPSDDLKAKAKEIIGMMLYDYELQALIVPYVTDAQRAMYLNPSMGYFYNACIDALPLEGDLVLEREMSALGENVSMTISLPLPKLPEELTVPAGEMLASVFSLPYSDVLGDLDRVTMTQSTGDISVSLSSPERTISLIIDESASNAETVMLDGFIRITPAAGNEEQPLYAAFAWKTKHTVYQDAEWIRHDDNSFELSVEPDLSLLAEDDPFRNAYVDFAPMKIALAVNYYNKTDNAYRPVQVDVILDAQLPDAELGMNAQLRVTEMWQLENLPTAGAQNLLQLSDEQINELLATLTTNAVITMTTLNTTPDAAQEPDAGVAETPVPPAA